jgi:hypothetical protein
MWQSSDTRKNFKSGKKKKFEKNMYDLFAFQFSFNSWEVVSFKIGRVSRIQI